MQICPRCNKNVAGETGYCFSCEGERAALLTRAQAIAAERPAMRIDELAKALGVSPAELTTYISSGGLRVHGYDSDRCDCGQPADPMLNGLCIACHNERATAFRQAAGLDKDEL